jgi:membrane protease YdiL (CAAX protease family)
LRDEKSRQAKLLQQLKLNSIDMLFLSLCAGIGEELLFRVGIQHYIGPILTSLLFVALHGYYSFTNWRVSLYGLLITPFIFILAYSLEPLGLWFCIAAHFSYDMVMFKVYAGRKNGQRIIS